MSHIWTLVWTVVGWGLQGSSWPQNVAFTTKRSKLWGDLDPVLCFFLALRSHKNVYYKTIIDKVLSTFSISFSVKLTRAWFDRRKHGFSPSFMALCHLSAHHHPLSCPLIDPFIALFYSPWGASLVSPSN